MTQKCTQKCQTSPHSPRSPLAHPSPCSHTRSLIAYIEISLSLTLPTILHQFSSLLQSNLPPSKVVLNFLFSPSFLTITNFHRLQTWSQIWSTYALYDISYVTPTSAGYAIDVMNGYTTLLPSLIYLSLSFGLVTEADLPPSLNARALGCVVGCVYYQMAFNTFGEAERGDKRRDETRRDARTYPKPFDISFRSSQSTFSRISVTPVIAVGG